MEPLYIAIITISSLGIAICVAWILGRFKRLKKEEILRNQAEKED